MLKVTKTSRIQIYINAGSNSFTGQRKDTCNEKLQKNGFSRFFYSLVRCSREMHKIVFKGSIVNGRGGHTELYVPGKKELQDSHPDWPIKLCSGSLNIKINNDGYPKEFKTNGLAETVKSLDAALFKAAFEIKQDQFGNNMLKATEAMPNRGAAQIWKSTLKINYSTIPCWALRRFGSGLAQELEVVSDVNIRNEHGLTKDKNWPCKIELYGKWVSTDVPPV